MQVSLTILNLVAHPWLTDRPTRAVALRLTSEVGSYSYLFFRYACSIRWNYQFNALQEAVASRDQQLRDLRQQLTVKEGAEARLKFDADCAVTRDADIAHLMIRAASLETSLKQASRHLWRRFK